MNILERLMTPELVLSIVGMACATVALLVAGLDQQTYAYLLGGFGGLGTTGAVLRARSSERSAAIAAVRSDNPS